MTDSTKSHDKYADSPSRISWSGWKRIVKRAVGRIMETNISLMCAGAAFFSFFSVFPMIASLVLLYGLFASPSAIAVQLASVQSLIPASIYTILNERLEALVSQPQQALGVGLLISIALALWSGSRGVNALMHALDVAYREKNERSFIMNALMSIGLTIGALMFLIIALGSIAILPAVLNVVPLARDVEIFASLIRWPVLAMVVLIMFAALLRQAPDRAAPSVRWLWPGALLATVLWLGLSVGFSYYVENFGNYGATFGALSTAVVLMLWLYYSTMAITFSAMVNAEAELETKHDTTSGIAKPLGQRGAFVADNHAPLSESDS